MNNKGTIALLIDGLDWRIVQKNNYKNLMQASYGTTDLSRYEILHSMIIWAEWLTGKNMEKQLAETLYEFKFRLPFVDRLKIRVPVRLGRFMEKKMWKEDRLGRMLSKLSPIRKMMDENIWKVRIPARKTIFRHFENYRAIDVPLFNHDYETHKEERIAMGEFFNDIHDKQLLREFESVVWEGYSKNKKELLDELPENNDLLVWFTPILDLYGHALICRREKILKAYKEVDDLVGNVRKQGRFVLIVSDHGMEKTGRHFGDHSKVGFWSTSEPLLLKRPRLEKLHRIIVKRRA